MSVSGKKVIVIEDDPVSRDLLKLALEAEGYTVVVSSDGVNLDKIIKLDLPDAIILDVMLPWIDGYELCRSIKNNIEIADIPTIFISAKAAPGDIERGYACGADAYFTKPLDLSVLAEKIDELIAARSYN